MKIFFIDPNNTTPRLNYPLIESLQKKGIEILYYSSSEFSKTDYYHENYHISPHYFFFKFSNKIRNIILRKSIKFFNYPFTILKLLVIILKDKPNIIHYNWITFPLCDLLFIQSIKLFGINVIITRHNYFKHNENRLKLFEKQIFKSVDRILCLSNFVKNEFEDIFQNKISVIEHGNCFVKEIIRFKDLKKKNSKYFNLLFVGSLKPYKGLDILLEAMIAISKDHKDIRLKIAGYANSNLNNQINNFIHKNDLSEYIEYENKFIEYSELFEKIINCDVGMLTYKKSTQSSLPYAFSAFYKPLIVTNYGGLKEQVACDFAEIVAANPQSITEAILKIKKRKIKKEAFENFLEEFSWDNTVSKYIKIYKEMVNE